MNHHLIICCFSGCISRKLSQKQRSWDLSWNFNMGCGCPKQWLNWLHYDTCPDAAILKQSSQTQYLNLIGIYDSRFVWSDPGEANPFSLLLFFNCCWIVQAGESSAQIFWEEKVPRTVQWLLFVSFLWIPLWKDRIERVEEEGRKIQLYLNSSLFFGDTVQIKKEEEGCCRR